MKSLMSNDSEKQIQTFIVLYVSTVHRHFTITTLTLLFMNSDTLRIPHFQYKYPHI